MACLFARANAKALAAADRALGLAPGVLWIEINRAHALILAWSLEGRFIDTNPCTRMGRLYGASRSDKIWSDEGEANFKAKAPAHLQLPLVMALWTGQRQGDLLALRWWAYDGKKISSCSPRT